MNIVSFVPEKGHYYQLSQAVDLKMYRCRTWPNELVKNADGQWVLKPIANVTYGNKYLPQDGGWQKMVRLVSEQGACPLAVACFLHIFSAFRALLVLSRTDDHLLCPAHAMINPSDDTSRSGR